jgi:hypothetical protein
VLEGASHELSRLGVDRLLESVVRRVARSGMVTQFNRVRPQYQAKKERSEGMRREWPP